MRLAPPEQEIQYQRQEDVKVFFHCQRPEMQVSSRRIALQEEHIMEQASQDRSRPNTMMCQSKQDRQQHENVKCRVDLEGAPERKTPESNHSSFLVFGEQES